MFVRLMLCTKDLAPDNDMPAAYVNGAQVEFVVPGTMYKPNPDYTSTPTEIHLASGNVLLVRPDLYDCNELSVLFNYRGGDAPCHVCRGSGANADRTNFCAECEGSGDSELRGEWPTIRR